MADIWQCTDQGLLARQRLQTTVFCQCYSPCGKFLAVGTNFGHVAVFSVPNALSPEANEESLKPIIVYKAHNGPVYTLVASQRFLISGGSGDIATWQWADITNKVTKPSWTYSVPTADHFAMPETNSLTLDHQTDTGSFLYAGCGDNAVHVWDIDNGKYLRALKGHTDYIHCVTVSPASHTCLSASEDGSVRLWDTRTPGQAVHVIEPYKNEDCVRPHHGKWVSCVSVDKDNDWMVCGGGPHLCLWHLRSLTPTTVFNTNACHNFVSFHEDSIISGGNEAYINHWSVNGDKKAQVPCSPTNVFDVAINDKSDNTKVLSMAGNCNKVDICTNFGYKAFSLSVY